jgi:hypothetical protein
MKKVILVFVGLFFYLGTMAQERTMQALAGLWEAVSSVNAGGGLEVKDSSQLYLVFGDQKKKITQYKIDFSQSPARFDFTVQQDSTTNLSLKSLLQFVNDDLIKWQVFEDDKVPMHFASSGGEIVYLRRKK